MKNYPEVILHSKSDIRWLRTTHLRSSTLPEFNSFMLYGNEDCPQKIELFAKRLPLYTDKPIATYTFMQLKEGDVYVRHDN